MTSNDELRDLAITHQIYFLRYQANIVREINDLLKMVEADLLSQLSSIDAFSNVDRLENQLSAVQAIILSATAAISEQLRADLSGLAEYEVAQQIASINLAVPVRLSMTVPPINVLVAAIESKPFQGKLLSEWMQKISDDSYIRIRDAIRIGIVEGESYDQITKRIIGTESLQYSDGALSLNSRQVQAIVATAISHASNEARQTFYSENTDIIKGVQWVSTLDARTTPVCQSRDGKVYPVDSGPRPPAHIRCRSTTVPVTKSWKELGINLEEAPPGTRASMDGQVAETETYQTWLSKKSPAFQDDVLGKSRGKLFRAGMTLDRFVDTSGKEYTLKQLKEKYSAIFDQAGVDI